MRSFKPLSFLGILVLAIAIGAAPRPVAGDEQRCPLDLKTCLQQFDLMRLRPWLGVTVNRDSLGGVTVTDVERGAPADRAGMRSGDVLETIQGKSPQEFFAGRAGWKTGGTGAVVVKRGGVKKTLTVPYELMSEERFARIVG